MKIGFVVNDVATEQPKYTTTRLAVSATQKGHEAWWIGLGDITYQPDGTMSAKARHSADKQYRSLERYLDDVQGPGGVAESIRLPDLDVLLLRGDPAVDATERPWAMTAALAFGQMLAHAGVLVLNDPGHLAYAMNKSYFQQFPETVRPSTLISRNEKELTEFVAEQGGRAVLKPLQGSGGSGVFQVTKDEAPNLNQIIEAISRDGYVVAQEYLPEADDGDVRMFVMNGEPLELDGTYAAFRRVNATADLRSNMKVGGKAQKVTVTDAMLHLVELVRPRLLSDGMFLVGLDIVGDKLMEVNVFSPGGFGSCLALYGVNFADQIIADIERKVDVALHHDGIPNHVLATL